MAYLYNEMFDAIFLCLFIISVLFKSLKYSCFVLISLNIIICMNSFFISQSLGPTLFLECLQFSYCIENAVKIVAGNGLLTKESFKSGSHMAITILIYPRKAIIRFMMFHRSSRVSLCFTCSLYFMSRNSERYA